jgi:hypothetical protein
MDVNEFPDEGGVTPFLGEDMVMTIYDWHPSPVVHHVSDLGPGALAFYGWGCGDTGM